MGLQLEEKDSLSHPILMTDLGFFQIIENRLKYLLKTQVTCEPHTGKVTTLLGQSFLKGTVSLEDIAKQMAMSPRSLQAKLMKEGQSFRKINDQVRKK